MQKASWIISLVIISTSSPVVLGGSETWEPIPLRTQAQRDAGMAGGEGMQMVFTIAYAPSNPDIVYLASDTSGVWKSIDAGFNWKPGNSGIRSMGGISVVVDPLNEDVVFVSGSLHSNFGTTSPVDGIYRTLDGGTSWSMVFETPYVRRKQGQHFVFDPNSFDGTRHLTIWAGTHDDGLLKSTDGGDNWNVVGLAGSLISDVELHPGNPHTLYVAAEDTTGLYRIEDDGVNPLAITPLPGLPDFPRSIALDAQPNPSDDILYAAVGSSKVFKSVNAGQTFVSKSVGLTVNDKDYEKISISPADASHLYVSVKTTTLQPFFTLDGGENWQQPTTIDEGNLDIFDGALGSFTYPIEPHPTNPDVALSAIAGRARVIATSNGGATWSYSGNGYMGGRRSGNHTSAYFDPANPNRRIFFLVDHGPVMTTDNGDTWRLLPTGQQATMGSGDPSDPNIIVAVVGGGPSGSNIWRSINGGDTWTTIANTTDSYRFMSFHAQDANVVYAGASSGSYISEDKGLTWTFIPDKTIRAMFPADGDIVYAFEPINSNSSILWHSDNRGDNWTQVATNPFGANGPQINDVDIDAQDPDRLYVSMSGAFWVFDGTSWTETAVSGGIATEVFGSTSSMNIKSLAAAPNISGTVYAGMWAGGLGQRNEFIYRSSDSGMTWQDIRFNLDTMPSTAWGLAVDPATSELHMSTAHGNFVLRSVPDTPADLDGDGSVGAFDLAILLGSWGPCRSCPADLDGDDQVGPADLAILLGSWGSCE